MLQGAEYEALRDDIRDNGQRIPIVIDDEGRVLDGRNRYRACEELDLEPEMEALDASIDPVRYVVSVNVLRRHLDESQRAMVAARLATLAQGARTDIASIEAMSQPKAAALLNVGRASVQRAEKVQTRGVPEVAAMVDAGEMPVSAAAELVDRPAAEQKEVVDRVKGGTARHVRDALRQIDYETKTETDLGEVAGLYDVVLADPPWTYGNSGFKGAAADHYPTMETDDICALPVKDHTIEASVLFLWVTNPLLEDGLRVLKAWGYEYKTNIAWVKDKGTHLGFYVNGYHELLLIGVRGSMLPYDKPLPRSVLESPRRKHSQKPDEVYDMIEKMYPGLSYLEMFARSEREGWKQWGNEPR